MIPKPLYVLFQYLNKGQCFVMCPTYVHIVQFVQCPINFVQQQQKRCFMIALKVATPVHLICASG